MNCQFLKQDPENPDYYICHKIIGICIGNLHQCPAFKQLLQEIFEDEENFRQDER